MPYLLLILATVALLAQSNPVGADNEGMFGGVAGGAPGNPGDERPEPDCPKGKVPGGPKKDPSDPVYLDTGEFYIPRDLLTTAEPSIPVRGDLVIDLRRTYRTEYPYNGALGYGWDFQFNRRLRQLDDGNLVVTSGWCRSSEYVWNGSTWDPPPGVFATLVQNGTGTYTQTFPNGRTETFDADGNLIEVADRHGNRLSMQYSTTKQPIHGVSEYFVDSASRVVTREYRLEKILDPVNRAITFAYDPNDGRLESFTDWSGRTWSYDHDDLGNLVSVTSPATRDHPAGTSTTYVYGDSRFPRKITEIIPPNGQSSGSAVVKNFYDGDGRVDYQIHGNGATVNFSYDDVNDVTTVISGNGTEWRYAHEDGQIKSVTAVTRGVRDPADEPVGTSYTTSFQFNAQMLRTRIVRPEGNAIERDFDVNNSNLMARSNLLAIRQLPKPGSSAPPLETRFTYKTPFQQIGTLTDPRGNVTEFFYDANHNLERIDFPTVPEGQPQQHQVVNAFGQLVERTDANGNTTRFEYDANGYLDKVIAASGTADEATTEFDPDALGRPTVVRDPLGNVTTLAFNAWGQLETQTAPAPFGYQTQYHYDESGNLLRVEQDSEIPTDPVTTTFTYNVRDWLLTRTNELGETTEFEYDENGNRGVVRDAAGNETTLLHDERDRVFQHIDAEARVTEFHYSSNGRLSRVVDGNGNATEYEGDAFDRLETVTHADGTTEVRGYDAGGNLTSFQTRAGATFTMSYDTLDRRRTRVTPADSETFAFDLGGRLTGAANGAVSLSYGYNARDELTREATTYATLLTPFEVSHAYDAAGNRTRTTYPDTSASLYAFDALRRLSSVSTTAALGSLPPPVLPTLVEERTYDPLFRVTVRSLSSGGEDRVTYDRISRITEIEYRKPGGGIDLLEYTWNTAGAITSRTDVYGTQSYTHDDTFQLTDVDFPTGSAFDDVSWRYDDAGSRVDETLPSGTTTYTTNALNQYTAIGGTARSHDQNGNLTSDGTATLTFDAQSRLAAAAIPGPGGPTQASYTYDPFMRRTSKTVDGETTYFLWSGDDLIEERGGSGMLKRRYVYAGGYAPALVQDPDGIGGFDARHVHVDHLGTPRVLTDEAGVPVWRAELSPFGRATIDPDPDGDPATPDPGIVFHVRLPGQYLDAETGLHYNRFRYYDPRAGRYVGPDPLGQLGDVAAYRYALNDPIHLTDSQGLLLDTLLDVGFILYDLYALATGDPCDFNTNLAALGADVLAAAIPGVTGAGPAVRVAAAADKAVDAAKGAGRAKNKLRPHGGAEGAHSTFKRGPDGKVSNHAEWQPNPKNPSGFDEAKRVDVTGRPHRNPDGTVVPTPHVREMGVKGVRPARPDEVP